MLELRDIRKSYRTGDLSVEALDGVSLAFREREFVSILGPSGSGKTTLLNIIGGLDQYTSGDLIINGRSTKEFRDRDWDRYRNHRIGFVFQSYNLIPHQSVLANVELALTLSGVGKAERRKRAVEVLQKVGLGDQLNKRPSQMSGGQMQRVAIARALINDPDILLADEPTGALDTKTSVQIMDLLKDVAKDKLVIMVTHNPELAEKYSTRIVRMQDGRLLSDSDPFDPASVPAVVQDTSGEKTSMSFGTALSLSLNNLMTKKGRTLLTAFAGSIGIIGIALILSLSNGAQEYINGVQEDTLASYPVQIDARTVDLTSMLSSAVQMREESEHPMDKVYSSNIMGDMTTLMQTQVQTNNLEAFKDYIEENEETFMEYANEISYSYDITPQVYTTLDDGTVQQVNPSPVIDEMGMGEMMASNAMMSSYSEAYNVFTELRESDTLREAGYELLEGEWPDSYDEVAVIVDPNNEISDYTQYTLGLKDLSEVSEMMAGGEDFETESLTFTYDELLGMEFTLVPASGYYEDEDGDGVWTDRSDDAAYVESLVEDGVTLRVVGILRETERSSAVPGGIGYTHALTEYLAEEAESAAVVQAQKADPDTDILTGKAFETDETAAEGETTTGTDDAVSSEPASEPAAESGTVSEEASSEISEPAAPSTPAFDPANLSEDDKLTLSPMAESMGMDPATMTDAEWQRVAEAAAAQMAGGSGEETVSQPEASVPETPAEEAPSQMEQNLAVLEEMGVDPSQLSEEQLSYLSTMTPAEVREMMASYAAPTENTYEGNLSAFGAVDLDSPAGIEIIPKSFEDKEAITGLISQYNDACTADGREEDTIDYTDMVGLLMSSVTTIINAISYILIAFVGISLVVSSIMIGIITYISVLERTKEIGILRAIGASKRDISNVFNAETLIIGFTSGAMGIIVTLLLLIPVNMVIDHLTGIAGLAALPAAGAVILVAISMALTFIAGLIPSKMAARKDPVEALRSE